jgi:selenocysteine-specific elongation factor
MDIIVGTAGHIDHGKTALVRALTGTDADRLPEEKQRGITIDIGFAELELGDARFGFVDVPGHERFVKNMLAGASGIDLVLLVIAADEGVMPQTREHFDICRLLQIKGGFVALTKSDLVDDEMLELVKGEVSEFVAGTFLDGAPIVPFSSRTGAGLDDIRNALASAAANITARDDEHVARLSIDRSFAMKGFGTVVTGTLASGKIADGDELDLLPQGKRSRVRGLQSHGRKVAFAYAGRRTAVNLAGIDHHDISRGMLLAETGILQPSQIIDTRVEMLSDAARGLRTRQRVRVHIGTAEVLARVAVIGGTEILPGKSGFAQLRLESPVAPILGERFIIRSYSPQVTIGGGSVLRPNSERFRGRDVEGLLSFLTTLSHAANDNVAALRALVDHASLRGLTSAEIRRVTGWNADSLSRAVKAVVGSGEIVALKDVLIAQYAIHDLEEDTLRSLEKLHNADRVASSVPIEKLRALTFRSVRLEIERAVLTKLEQSGKIDLAADSIGLAGRGPRLSVNEETALASMRDIFASGGLEVPKIDVLLKNAADASKISVDTARKLLQQLFDSGEIVRISPEFAVSKTVLNGLIEKLRASAAALPGRLIDVPSFKDIAGVSRKYAIPLLEYFDQQKITARRGDKRLVL